MDEPWAWVDGVTLAASEAKVSCLDRGYQYGDGVFETIRAEDGRGFFLEAHLERLRAGLEALRIDLPDAGRRAREGVAAVLERLGAVTATLKIVATRGVGPAGPTTLGDFRPSVVVTGRPDRADRPAGFRAVVSSTIRNERSPLVRVKSLNYLEMVIARTEAREAGADEAILLNTCGRVAEASAANVFVVQERRLLTPPEAEGCLPGIARAEVLKAAAALGIGAAEEPLMPEDLRRADEVFLTNSRIGVVPLVELDGEPLGAAPPGPATRRLREAFREAEFGSR